MTTSPVMTVTDELLAELEDTANKATGGDWEYRLGLIRAMPDQDGYVPIAVAPNSPKNWRGQRDANMQHIAAANPVTITALTAELRRLRAENAELAQSLEESRANDQAAMGWLTSLRWASGDRGERMLPELVTHIEGLAKDAGRYRWMCSVKGLSVTSDGSTWTRQDGRAYVSAHTLCANGSQYAGRETLSDAIDTAMATK